MRIVHSGQKSTVVGAEIRILSDRVMHGWSRRNGHAAVAPATRCRRQPDWIPNTQPLLFGVQDSQHFTAGLAAGPPRRSRDEFCPIKTRVFCPAPSGVDINAASEARR
jgi:hypothetical protein